MSKIILYHGSSEIVKHPCYEKGSPDNDYGQGFYCTEHIELAKEWACSENTDGYANKYEFDMSELKVLNLSDDDYSVLNWLAILLYNRKPRISSSIGRQGRKYLIENFLPNYKNYDVIIGYRADDSYFSFARAFVNNQISLKQLGYAMRLGKLGEQYFIQSQKAFDSIRFIDYTIADNSVYYAKKVSRDIEARESFDKELENDDINGIYIRDIIREEMKNNDSRLR